MAVEYRCCEASFFAHVAVIVVLVLFAGLMSGLTLGLMSLSLVDLEVLAKSGTPQDRKHAAKILPVVKRQHLLLCTLLICNAAAMELGHCMGRDIALCNADTSVWRGEPFASRNVISLLLYLQMLTLPGSVQVDYPSGRLFSLWFGNRRCRCSTCSCTSLDMLSRRVSDQQGDGHAALFRRAELKTLVTLHGNEAGKGGELTHDETTIIAGALELTNKTARDAMTPLSQTFAVDINAKLDKEFMQQILDKGHSRVPVYYEKPTNIIGLILVKNLLTIHPDDEVPVKNVTIRKIPRVPEDMPLYDILNEFQKGHSHMAVVAKQSNLTQQPSNSQDGEDLRIDIDGEKSIDKVVKATKPMTRWKSNPNSQHSNRGNRNRKWMRDDADVLQVHDNPLPKLSEDEEAIGIITMEDVIEELLQEEIFDETDIHEDQ